jgi:hypothetical protein
VVLGRRLEYRVDQASFLAHVCEAGVAGAALTSGPGSIEDDAYLIDLQ